MQPTKPLGKVGTLSPAMSTQFISASERLFVVQWTFIDETRNTLNKITTADCASLMCLKQPWNIRRVMVVSRLPEGLRVALMRNTKLQFSLHMR